MRAWVHGQWGGLAVIGRLDMRLRRPTLPSVPRGCTFFLQASSRRAAGGRLGSTHLSTCCTHGLLACCCRHVPPIPMMPSATSSGSAFTLHQLINYFPKIRFHGPIRIDSSLFKFDFLSSLPDLPPSDCEPSDGDFVSSQPDLPPSDWTNQTPSVLNRPLCLIPSESPPPLQVRVHPSACSHIPHPTFAFCLPPTPPCRCPLFHSHSPLARAGAD